jgi:tetratricopeptide (TPR) repeat protein
MSKSNTSKLPRFLLIALLVFLVGGVAVAGTISLSHSWRIKKALQYATKAEQSDDLTTITLNYRYANLLDPTNPTYIEHLAAVYLAQEEPNSAQTALDTLKPIERKGLTSAGFTTKSQALLELNRLDEAETTAKQGIQKGSRERAQLQLGLIYALRGNSTGLADTITALGNTEAVQTLAKVGESKYLLAQELFLLGLPVSSERVLAVAPDSAMVRLQARIRLLLYPQNAKELQVTKVLLQKAITNDPADTELRKLLIITDTNLKLPTEAKSEQDAVTKLETGKL